MELVKAGKSPEQAALEVGTAVNVARRAAKGIFPQATWAEDAEPAEVEVEVRLRLPLSVAADVQAEARRQGRSFSAEVVRRLGGT